MAVETQDIKCYGTKPIRWLEDPLRYEYVRGSLYSSVGRRYFRKGKGIRGLSRDFYKLVGYRLREVAIDGIYIYEIYWLKRYDCGCPEEHPNYAKGKLMPSEAIPSVCFVMNAEV